MLMSKIDVLNSVFEKQTTYIVEEMRTELNAQNVGGDLYKEGCAWEKIKSDNESFLGKIQDLSGTNTGEYGQAEEKTED